MDKEKKYYCPNVVKGNKCNEELLFLSRDDSYYCVQCMISFPASRIKPRSTKQSSSERIIPL